MKLKLAAVDNSLRKRYIQGMLEVLDERVWTTASLSERNNLYADGTTEGPKREML